MLNSFLTEVFFYAQGNSLLHEIFNFGVDKTEGLSNTAKVFFFFLFYSLGEDAFQIIISRIV